MWLCRRRVGGQRPPGNQRGLIEAVKSAQGAGINAKRLEVGRFFADNAAGDLFGGSSLARVQGLHCDGNSGWSEPGRNLQSSLPLVLGKVRYSIALPNQP